MNTIYCRFFMEGEAADPSVDLSAVVGIATPWRQHPNGKSTNFQCALPWPEFAARVKRVSRGFPGVGFKFLWQGPESGINWQLANGTSQMFAEFTRTRDPYEFQQIHQLCRDAVQCPDPVFPGG